MTIIKTSCWFTEMPANHIKIGISRGTPRGHAAGYKLYKTLAPGRWFNSVSASQYKQLYWSEVLDKLSPEITVSEIIQKSEGKVPVLVCYERAEQPEWCHRGFVSAWLHDTLGYEVCELHYEDRGFGWSHPKLPPQFLQQIVPDRSNELKKIIGTTFLRNGVEYKISSIDDKNSDHVIVQSSNATLSVHADTIKSILNNGAATGIAPAR